MDGRVMLVCGNRYGQVFATKDFFCEIYPMATRILLARLLRNLCRITVSRSSSFDSSKQNLPCVGDTLSKQSAAEDAIREWRRKWLEPWCTSVCHVGSGITAQDDLLQKRRA